MSAYVCLCVISESMSFCCLANTFHCGPFPFPHLHDAAHTQMDRFIADDSLARVSGSGAYNASSLQADLQSLRQAVAGLQLQQPQQQQQQQHQHSSSSPSPSPSPVASAAGSPSPLTTYSSPSAGITTPSDQLLNQVSSQLDANLGNIGNSPSLGTGSSPSSSSALPAPSSDSSGQLLPQPQPVATVDGSEEAFQQALANFFSLHGCQQQQQPQSPPTAVLQTLQTVAFYIRNILGNLESSGNLSFCRLVFTNPTFQARIAKMEGAQALLLGIGFRAKRLMLEWPLQQVQQAAADQGIAVEDTPAVRVLLAAKAAIVEAQQNLKKPQPQQQHQQQASVDLDSAVVAPVVVASVAVHQKQPEGAAEDAQQQAQAIAAVEPVTVFSKEELSAVSSQQ